MSSSSLPFGATSRGISWGPATKPVIGGREEVECGVDSRRSGYLGGEEWVMHL